MRMVYVSAPPEILLPFASHRVIDTVCVAAVCSADGRLWDTPMASVALAKSWMTSVARSTPVPQSNISYSWLDTVKGGTGNDEDSHAAATIVVVCATSVDVMAGAEVGTRPNVRAEMLHHPCILGGPQ